MSKKKIILGFIGAIFALIFAVCFMVMVGLEVAQLAGVMMGDDKLEPYLANSIAALLWFAYFGITLGVYKPTKGKDVSFGMFFTFVMDILVIVIAFMLTGLVVWMAWICVISLVLMLIFVIACVFVK